MRLNVRALKELIGGWDDEEEVSIKVVGPHIYLTTDKKRGWGEGHTYHYNNGLSTIVVGPVLPGGDIEF